MTTRTALIAALLMGTLLVAGCGPRSVLETGGAPLDIAGVVRLAKSADLSSVSGVTVADAPAKRTAVLSELRTHGEPGDKAASYLTRGFPPDTASVPVLVRFCKVDGVDSVVVVEAYGTGAGPLDRRRLWVFDAATGTVTRAGSYR